jgi:hypothetical protein
MARTLPEHDQDWSDVDRREEPPERVSLPAWGWLGLAFVLAFYLRGPLATLLDGPNSLIVCRTDGLWPGWIGRHHRRW